MPDAPPDDASPGGGSGNARDTAGHLLGLIQARAELFLLELEEEKIRLVELLIWLGVALVFGLALLLVVSVVAVFFMPDAWRGTGLLALGGVYGLVCVFALWRIRRGLTQRTPPFEESLGQLKKDRSCFSDPK